MLLLGNWGQQMDIEDQKREIEDLRHHMRQNARPQGAGNLASRVAELEQENDELRLYLASLVRYLGNKGVLQKDEFARLVEAVDAEDGKADGRYGGEIGK